MTTVHLTGASDDLIEIDGDISEEWGAREDGDLLAFSDGTVLRIKYTDDGDGIWRITPVARGTADLVIDQCAGDDPDRYTDKATLTGDIRWAVRGDRIEQTR